MPQEDGTVPSTLVAVKAVREGFTEAGTESVAVLVEVPIKVEPL